MFEMKKEEIPENLRSVMCRYCYANVTKTKLGNWKHQPTFKRRHGFCGNTLTDNDVVYFLDERKQNRNTKYRNSSAKGNV